MTDGDSFYIVTNSHSKAIEIVEDYDRDGYQIIRHSDECMFPVNLVKGKSTITIEVTERQVRRDG